MATANRSETFGRLLKAAISSIANCEGKTAPIIEDELGGLIGIAGKTIQRYKSGHIPTESRTVQILAEACVKRGMMGREWLEAFLHHARYPFAEKLLEQLRPAPHVRPRPPRIYENLPAPTYNQFVMRQQAFADVIEGLQQRSAVVLIVGMGGNGKTSLAREVAACCLQKDSDTLSFDAVVWVSDKDFPGTTNLSVVLDEIAYTLDYPGFMQYEYTEKRREVEQLLRRQRVLLIVDNFETITDSALLSWLLRLPVPSKAIITSREYRREWRSSWPVELRGMSESEAHILIEQRLRTLRIEKLVSNFDQIEHLLSATGGNPKAIELTLGLVKYEYRSLSQVLDDLYAARGDIFDDLFTRAWALLDESARRVLLVTTFFRTSASSEALSATADVSGFAFERAVERLIDLALLDVHKEEVNSLPRYVLHSLVRAFVGAKLRGQTEFETVARNRWIKWYSQLAASVGWCWNDLDKLKILDIEQENAFIVAEWAFEYYRDEQFLILTAGVMYYYRVRGQWSKLIALYQKRLLVTQRLKQVAQEVEVLADYVQLLSLQGNLVGSVDLLHRLSELLHYPNLPRDILFNSQESIALNFAARQDYVSAQNLLEKILTQYAPLSQRETVRIQRWIAFMLYYRGEFDKAYRLFQQILPESQQINSTRITLSIQVKLADVLIEQGKLDEAQYILDSSQEIAERYYEYRHRSSVRFVYARLHTLRGDILAARTDLAEAIDLFERLGMRRELAEARQAMIDLEVREASVT